MEILTMVIGITAAVGWGFWIDERMKVKRAAERRIARNKLKRLRAQRLYVGKIESK